MLKVKILKGTEYQSTLTVSNMVNAPFKGIFRLKKAFHHRVAYLHSEE